MTAAHRQHEEMLLVLREKKFERLAIKRFEANCYLIIVVDGRSYVFADHAGQKKEYRHAWQVRSWLKSTFGISTDSIPVEMIKS
jgi:hypothetical protein